MADTASNPALDPTAVRCPTCAIWQPWREAFIGLLDTLTKFRCMYCASTFTVIIPACAHRGRPKLFMVKPPKRDEPDERWFTKEEPQGRSWASLGGVRPPRRL
jgi:hypothetical protein